MEKLFGKFENNLLDALENKKIQQRIREIVNQDVSAGQHAVPLKDNYSLNDEMSEKINQLQKEVDYYKKQNKNLLPQLEQKEISLHNAIDSVNKLKNEHMTFTGKIQELSSALSKQNNVIGNLQDKLSDAEYQLEHQRKQNESTLSECNMLRDKCGRLNADMKKAADALKPYVSLNDAFSRYCSLPNNIRIDLNKVIGCDSPVDFLVYGCQFENIKALWNYTKSELGSISDRDIHILVDTMSFFVDKINLMYESPVYQIAADNVGSAFDSARHIKSRNCSPYQGNIIRVLLPGIQNVNSGDFICKCVVEY